MKGNVHHRAILKEIESQAGVATSHTFSDSYLGNSHPRYAIAAPALRSIAKAWARQNKDLTSSEFCEVINALVYAPSSTEKIIGGMILDYGTKEQLRFDPKIFDSWLEHLEGWAEVDAVCTGEYTIKAIPTDWDNWEKIIKRFVKSKNIHKRRASLVLFCSPIRYSSDEAMATLAFANIELLKHEKEVLITKAISWLLRSMIKNFKKEVADYVSKNKASLPPIAVRETLVTLRTGKKTK